MPRRCKIGVGRAAAPNVPDRQRGGCKRDGEAVAGGGSENLVGRRFPSSTGVAGWVLVTRQPLVIDDLAQDARFSREAAESTGYVPRSLMAVPLLVEDRVLAVLDLLRGTRRDVRGLQRRGIVLAGRLAELRLAPPA